MSSTRYSVETIVGVLMLVVGIIMTAGGAWVYESTSTGIDAVVGVITGLMAMALIALAIGVLLVVAGIVLILVGERGLKRQLKRLRRKRRRRA